MQLNDKTIVETQECKNSCESQLYNYKSLLTDNQECLEQS